MPVNESLREVLDKGWEEKPLKEIVKSSVINIQGIGPERAKALEDFGVKTVEDLATNKYILWAQALVTLAKTEK